MKIFTIHLRGQAHAPDRDALVIKEGFCWPAFFFGPLWALWHRMWFAFAGLASVLVLMIAGAALLGVNDAAFNAVLVGAAAIVGFCANDWRRAGLTAGGWQMKGISAAADRDTALRRFIDLHPGTFDPAPAGSTPGA